jgi:hypothetical protein
VFAKVAAFEVSVRAKYAPASFPAIVPPERRAEAEPDVLPVEAASGAEVISALIVIVSVATVPEGRYTFTGTYEATPLRAAGRSPTTIDAAVRAVAVEGTTDNIPKPKAATATSATRLKVVFVDICFLSISRTLEFPGLGFG